MYLRTVLRSWPVRSAIADTDKPCLCNSRIIINSFRLTTRPPHAPLSDADARVRCAKRSRASARRRFTDQTGEIFNRRKWGVFVRRRHGVVLPLKAATVRRRAAAQLDALPVLAQRALGDLLAHLTDLDGRIGEYDTQLKLAARDDEHARRLMNLRGVGPVGASAIVATVGSAHEFRNGRQFAAWLGMVPRQYSSGGKARLGRITKAGDAYLRTLLIMGARAVLAAAAGSTDRISRWALALQARRGYMRAVVAIAAKNARLAWAMLRQGEDFRLREVTA